jgi:HlyD family secretion protein
VLAQLDPTFLKAQVAQSEAELARADVELRKAVRDSTRVFSLQAEDLVSQSDLDVAQTAVDAARASVASARAAVDRARTNLRYATISSPIDGVIVSRDVDVGQTVAASLSAPTLFTIAKDLTRMQLEAAVDEADIGQIREGQSATFTVDAHPTRRFTGSVGQIRLAPQTVQNVVTYTVVILVENPEKILLPGMTANVSILVDEADDVLRVPSAALRFKPQGNGASAAGGPAERAGRGEGPGGQAGSRGGAPAETRAAQTGTIYAFRPPESPRSLTVRTGPTDGTYTAVYSDSLSEGMEIVVGAETSGNKKKEVVNPFMPNRNRARGR